MPYKPHLRLTLAGQIANDEIFSCNLSLVPHTNAFQTAVSGLAQTALLTGLLVDFQGSNFEDMVTDCVNFWARPESGIHAYAKLQSIKLASIDEDGHYSAVPLEAVRNTEGGGSSNDDECPPWQISKRITFETDGDLQRIKGGFYLPLPAMGDGRFEPSTDLWSVASTEAVRGSVVQFLNDLANEPGWDDQDMRPVVASQGRHGPNGAVRVGPGNWEIKRVSVGRRPDVIRRRANHRTESRVSALSTSF